jgi:predicted transcriptional regulator
MKGQIECKKISAACCIAKRSNGYGNLVGSLILWYQTIQLGNTMTRMMMPITPLRSIFLRIPMLSLILVLILYGLPAIAEDKLWPSFTATMLSGEKVDSGKLLGQPTLLILTPSRDAAQSIRKWVETLRSEIDQSKYRVRDVLAVDLPFFMSEEDAISMAKKKVPQRYHDQTWILNSQIMENALDVPSDSDEAVIIVLDKQGHLVSQVHGKVTPLRMSKVTGALQSLFIE